MVIKKCTVVQSLIAKGCKGPGSGFSLVFFKWKCCGGFVGLGGFAGRGLVGFFRRVFAANYQQILVFMQHALQLTEAV